MSKLSLIIIVFLILLIICLIILMIPGQKKKANKIMKIEKNSAVNVIMGEENGLIRIEYTSFEDMPTPQEVFPDYYPEEPPELPSQENALTPEFWQEYSRFDSLSIERKLELCQMLVDHGFMDRKKLEEFSFELPIDESTGAPLLELPPDPADDDAYEAFWKKKFPDE